jgi:hypothetical protein
MSIKQQYAGRSQADIHKAVCALTDDILKLRKKAHTYGERMRLQRLRQQRAQLQELLNGPVLVWIAP